MMKMLKMKEKISLLIEISIKVFLRKKLSKIYIRRMKY